MGTPISSSLVSCRAVNPLAAGLAGAIPIRPDRFSSMPPAGSLLWAGAWITSAISAPM